MFCLALLSLQTVAAADGVRPEPDYVRLPGGSFVSDLAGPDGKPQVPRLDPFSMRTEPVSELDMQNFLLRHPEWQKDRISSLFADSRYLADWVNPTTPSHPNPANYPVVNVTWYVARAYCASEHARLPTWFEWEYAAAADATHSDARNLPGYQNEILQRATSPPENLAGMHRSVAGIYGLHDGWWEWLDDQQALFGAGDSRAGDHTASLALCGGAALTFYNRKNYALILAAGALANLHPRDSSPVTTFRCVRPEERGPQ